MAEATEHPRISCDSPAIAQSLQLAAGQQLRNMASLGGDLRRARYVNDNLADYLIPVNADIDQLEVVLVPEEDRYVSPAGVKGIGELANVGTAAAVANAVYHATGKRVRDLPIRLEKQR
jgi:hypothetical protein